MFSFVISYTQFVFVFSFFKIQFNIFVFPIYHVYFEVSPVISAHTFAIFIKDQSINQASNKELFQCLKVIN